MDCTWHELVVGLEEEPALSIEPEIDHAVESVFVVAPDGVVEPVPVRAGGFAPASSDIDWDNLEILARKDDEGRLDIVGDETFYELLGLRAEDQAAEEARQAAVQGGAPEGGADAGGVAAAVDTGDIAGAAIPVHDEVPGERGMAYDPNKPCMKAGTVYPNMKEFRLAIRQYAINAEFELKLVKTDPERYIGGCKVEDCPWHIVGHKQPNQKTVMVTVLRDLHTCTSSSRRRTTTPTAKWVASKTVAILRKNPGMGPKAMQTQLEEDHKCTISYDTVFRGREKAMVELYGTWEESFHMLYRWRAEVLRTSPGSVIEIDTVEVGGKVYFHRFFCALRSCIDGFLEGCRPYISIDSTALNGRWNGHLAAATSVDGHHWMYPLAFGFINAETEDNWEWFMRQLHKAIGDVNPLAICTDACKGLEKAVHTVFEHVEQKSNAIGHIRTSLEVLKMQFESSET